jgi:hypothetical protein
MITELPCAIPTRLQMPIRRAYPNHAIDGGRKTLHYQSTFDKLQRASESGSNNWC